MARLHRHLLPGILISTVYAVAAACSSDDVTGGFTPLDAGADGSLGGSAAGGSGTSPGGSGGRGGATGGTAGSGGAATGGTAGSGGSGAPEPCTSDSDCSGALGRCHPDRDVCVACLFNNECAEGQTCSDGTCSDPLSCTNARDCRDQSTTLTICNDSSVCVECAADADCGDGRVCAVDTCVESNACATTEDCSAGRVCDVSTSQCVECLAGGGLDAGDAGTCPTGESCSGGFCRTDCASDNDCATGNQLCDEDAGVCVDCVAHGDCASLEHCDNGFCKPDVCAQGVKSCVAGTVVECNESGSGTLDPVVCGDGQACQRVGDAVGCVDLSQPDGGVLPAECNDQTLNGDETDVDCGGSCPKCGTGKLCSDGDDCTSGVCEPDCSGLLCLPGTRTPVCRDASCNDNNQNGQETDVDCGGPDCPRCSNGSGCQSDSDCESNLCSGGTCEQVPCDAALCAACLFPTNQPCCLPNGDCGCAQTIPFPGSCN
jgi:Cys-rich repeat protein